MDRHLQDVIRYINELKYRLVVHPRSILEIEKDKNIPDPNRSALLSKIRAYPTLDSQSNPYDDKDFFKLIQKPKSERDTVDSYLLYCLYKKEVDLFLTEDVGIVDKAEKLNIFNRVLNLQEASSLFKKTLDERKTKGDDVPVFCFYKKGSRWYIGEKDREIPYDDQDGFGFIHSLLLNEYKDISSSDLYNDGKISGDEDPHGETSKRERFDLGLYPEAPIYNKRLSAEDRRIIESEIVLRQEAIADGGLPLEEKEKKEEEIDMLRKALNKRSERTPNSPSERVRVRVYKSVKRALNKIATDETISTYLNTHTIDTGDTCVYRPLVPDKPRWILFPDSKSK
jgi:hypothetical protein